MTSTVPVDFVAEAAGSIAVVGNAGSLYIACNVSWSAEMVGSDALAYFGRVVLTSLLFESVVPAYG